MRIATMPCALALPHFGILINLTDLTIEQFTTCLDFAQEITGIRKPSIGWTIVCLIAKRRRPPKSLAKTILSQICQLLPLVFAQDLASQLIGQLELF